jgi:hypothetical protein
MATKNQYPEDQPLEQGRLFSGEVSDDSGVQLGEIVEGGIYLEKLSTPEGDLKSIDQVAHEAALARQQSRNRQRAQEGKHSPLKRDGHYGDIRPGDVLPGHGPVRDRDWDEATRQADRLEQDRLREQAAQPSLLEKPSIVQGLGQLAQGAVAGTEASLSDTPRTPYDPNEQRPFVAIPNLLAIKPDLNYGLTIEDISNVKVVSLGKRLFGRGRRTVDGVRLSPAEFGAVGLNTERLLERAENHASKKYENANPILKREHELRDRLEAGEGLEKRQTDIVTKLQSELDSVQTLLGYVKRNPNLRRAKDADTRVMAAEVWGSIEGMLKVAAESVDPTSGLKEWTYDEYEGARQAILRELTTGPHGAQMAGWRRVLRLDYDYTRAKLAVFAPRLDEVTRRHQADSDELNNLLAENGFATR